MKKSILNLFCSLFCIVSIAQIQDLSDLASGQFVSFGMLFNNYDPDDTCYICDEKADVFGYYSLYNNGEIKENVYEIEYILFDKNLNKFSNGTFDVLKAPKKTSSYLNLYKKQDTIIIVNKLNTVSNFDYNKNFFIYRKLSLKDNKLLEPYYYEKLDKKTLKIDEIAADFSKKKLRSLNREIEWTEKQKDSARTRETLFSYNEEKVKLLLNTEKLEKEKKSSKEYKESLELIEGEKQLWKTKLPIPDKKEFVNFKELYLDKKSKEIAFVKFWKNYKDKESNSKIQLYDLETGSLKNTSSGFNTNYGYVNENIYNLTGDNITVLSAMFGKGYRFHGLNFYRYNVKTNKELVNHEFLWESASNYMKIKKYGYVEKGLRLRLLNYFFLKDGRFGMLTEKFKTTQYSGRDITTDFVFFMFDKSLNLEGVKVIEKDKTMSTERSVDYLFSQEVDGGSLIYYKDYQKGEGEKKKKWVLGILSYINGKIEHQKIPMSSEDYSILPYPAKEGYILLREFNDANNKYNKIRLEKINY